MMYSLAKAMGFSLDIPWEKLPEKIRRAIPYGIEPAKVEMLVPSEAKDKRDDRVGKQVGLVVSPGESSGATAGTGNGARRTPPRNA